MTLPTLYKKTSTGKIQMWEIEAYGSDGPTGVGYIKTVYGHLDGGKQTASETITEGKNPGKANATTPLEQAVAEAKSQWEKKLKKGYVENLDDAEQGKIDTSMITGGVEPMLAHPYDKQGHKIKYPAYMQPKLDGHRCIAIVQDGKCTLWSRTRKRINSMPHIERALETMFVREATVILDGELYNHDYREKFEQLTSLIRQEKPAPGHEAVEYWVYDFVDDKPFSKRYEALSLFSLLVSSKTQTPIRVVETTEVQDAEDMAGVFAAYLDFGFEGGMLRNTDGNYLNKRSYDLQKVKIMQDAEFEIIDVTEGRGKMAGKAMFHCVTSDGKPFRVKMKGTLDSLSHYLDHKDDYIGKQLTVKYQNLSADGIPRFPIGERIHESL
jgi:DNA ligase-1